MYDEIYKCRYSRHLGNWLRQWGSKGNGTAILSDGGQVEKPDSVTLEGGAQNALTPSSVCPSSFHLNFTPLGVSWAILIAGLDGEDRVLVKLYESLGLFTV